MADVTPTTPDQWNARVGQHVTARRRQKKIRSMRQAAAEAGFNEATWRQIESGRRQLAPGHIVVTHPTTETLAATARVLDWPDDWLDYFLRGEHPPDVERHARAPSVEDELRAEVRALRRRVDDLEKRMPDPQAES